MRKNLPNYRFVAGFTGPIASGKGLAVEAVREVCREQGSVRSILLSDYIREQVRSEGKRLTRDTLREAGNALRKKKGRARGCAKCSRIFRKLTRACF